MHKAMDWVSVEEIYTIRHKNSIESGKLTKYKGKTDDFFQSPEGSQRFDFIYIDADHEAASALKDGLNSIYRLNPGGIVAFDDYSWNSGKGDWANPKSGIDAILSCYSHKISVLDTGSQVWIKIDNPL
jgi:predicted O-methyltransferase YrrM